MVISTLEARKRKKYRFALQREPPPSVRERSVSSFPRGPSIHPERFSSPYLAHIWTSACCRGWGNSRQSKYGYIKPRRPVQMSCQTIAANQNFCSSNWPFQIEREWNKIKKKRKMLVPIGARLGSLSKLVINTNRGQAVHWFRWGHLKHKEDQSLPRSPLGGGSVGLGWRNQHDRLVNPIIHVTLE